MSNGIQDKTGLRRLTAGVPAGAATSKTRWIAVATSFVLAATIGGLVNPSRAQAQTSVPANSASAVAPAEKVIERPDRTSAFLAAQLQGSRVEISGERTETSTMWANPDGTLTADESTGPVRVLKDDGWVPLDLDLVEVAGGWAPKASPSTVTFSGGGDGPAVKLEDGSKNVRMDWVQSLPAPIIKGARATYALDDTTDLVLTALPDGFEQLLVLKAAPAKAPKLHMPLDLTGLSVRDEEDGNGWQFIDTKDKVVFETLKRACLILCV